MLKKLTFLAILTAPAFATNTPLTIKPTQLDTGDASINWIEDDAQLTSWELSFTLTTQQDASGYIFHTKKPSYTSPYISLKLENNVFLIEYKQKSTAQSTPLLLNNTPINSDTTTITLSFISQNHDNINSPIAYLSLTVNETTITETLINQEYIDTAILSKNTDNTTYCYITANEGNTKLYNISLSKLNNLNIPEPSTVTLSLIGLIALLTKRKRK